MPTDQFSAGADTEIRAGAYLAEAAQERLPTPIGPLTSFPANSEFAVLDEIGRDLPSLLHDRGFRDYAQTFRIPLWPEGRIGHQDQPYLRLYYVRVGLLASAYVNQVGEEPATELPGNLAAPLCRACKLLKRPPIQLRRLCVIQLEALSRGRPDRPG